MAHEPNSGNRPMGWRVVSKAKTAEASMAREAPEKIEAMPTSAAMRASTPRAGASEAHTVPNIDPRAPPMVSSGASVPPEVPLPRAMDQDRNFMPQRNAAAV